MASDYGIRYLPAKRFAHYCTSLNVKTDLRELEHYEKTGVMLPVARVIYPEDYATQSALSRYGAADESLDLTQWPELAKLFDEPRVLPADFASLKDEELIDSFDREMGRNSCLMRPTPETFKPWDSYRLSVPRKGYQLPASTAEHYYGYWQVHQLYHIQEYPDLYRNLSLLQNISEDVKQKIGRPWAPPQQNLREFEGKAHLFDALSFWITVYEAEHQRTFALIPEKHQVKRLDAAQYQTYMGRLTARAKGVQTQYGITVDDLYQFLHQLLELQDEYGRAERYKLSDALKSDMVHLAHLVRVLTGLQWDGVAQELGRRYTVWTERDFRHLDTVAKERDEAFEALQVWAKQYGARLHKLNIPGAKRSFPDSQINEMLDYCMREGPSILVTALSGMIATQEEVAEKFRQAARYTNLKNILTGLEYLLKNLAAAGGISATSARTLKPLIREVMKGETGWTGLFVDRTKNDPAQGKKDLTQAETPTQAYNNLVALLADVDLLQSEDTYWARVFLIACLARNLTVHWHPDDDWFYGELFGEMLTGACYALMYTWQVARRRGWV